MAYNPNKTPFISRWKNPLILTIDPNFLKHPTRSPFFSASASESTRKSIASAKPSRTGSTSWVSARPTKDHRSIETYVYIYIFISIYLYVYTCICIYHMYMLCVYKFEYMYMYIYIYPYFWGRLDGLKKMNAYQSTFYSQSMGELNSFLGGCRSNMFSK